MDSSNAIIYSFTIDGSKLDVFDKPLNSNITFKSGFQSILQGLVKDKNYLSINIEQEGKLPNGIIIKIFVADKFTSSEKPLYLYYFNTETKSLELVQEKIQITDGYIILQLDHASEYILADSTLKTTKGYSSWLTILISIVVGLSIIGLVLVIVIIKKKKFLISRLYRYFLVLKGCIKICLQGRTLQTR